MSQCLLTTVFSFGATKPVQSTGYTVMHVCAVELLLSGDYKVRDGGLVDEFKAVRLEFHWSDTNRRGSEHYINDTAFPLEVRTPDYCRFYYPCGFY